MDHPDFEGLDMKKFMTFAAALLLAAVVATPAAAQANVAGAWAITIQGPEGPAEAMATLEQDGSSFSGTITVDQAEGASISDGMIEGNTMSFQLMISVQGMEIALSVEGQVDGDTIEGEMFVPDFGGFPFTAQRN
jgi:hypothetical protein